MANPCWLGHRFRPRYSTTPPTKVNFGESADPFWSPTFSPERTFSAKAEMIRSLTRKTYERDVCERCGQTVEKANA